MALDIDTQVALLCDQLMRTDASNVAVKEKVLEYIRTYASEASPGALAKAYDSISKKYGIPVSQLVGETGRDVGGEYTGLVHPKLPHTGWLGDYLDYTKRHEAPDIFHFWVGVSIICGAIRRAVYFEQGYYKVFPNFYVILVAPPGACKKSTATNIGVELLNNLPDLNIVREKITPEGLIANLHENIKLQVRAGTGLVLHPSATAFIHAPELAVFLGRETYNEGIIALLTSLFDCHTKWEYTTRGAGKLQLHNLHLVLLGATTPDLISSVLPSSAMGGGFLSRVIFVNKEKTPRCEPFPVVRDPLQKEQLLARLVNMMDRGGQIVQSQAGMEWCIHWYQTHHQQAHDDIALSGYYERKQEHLIKLSMVLLLSEEQDLIITDKTYQKAADILDLTERTMSEAFVRTQSTQVGRDHERILRQLDKGGGTARHSELLKKNYGYLSSDGFKKAMQTLQEAGMISIATTQKGGIAYTLVRKR